MELEDLKSDYQNAGRQKLSKEKIEEFVQEKSHPVLKSIKRQLAIESLCWLVFLVVFYDFFDGHLRTPLWNFLLVIGVVLVLLHNFLGYRIITNPIQSKNILDSLERYLSRIKKYAVLSIFSRVLAIILILGYFVSAIEMTNEKLWSLGLFMLIIPIQVYLLRKVWNGRIIQIKDIYQKINKGNFLT